MNAALTPVHTAVDAIALMRGKFIGNDQCAAILDVLRGEESEWMAEKVNSLWATIQSMPQSYQTDGQDPEKTLCHLHYFVGTVDAWITEKDMGERRKWTPEVEQHQAFGVTRIQPGSGELGYVSIPELLECGAEIDLYWTPCTLASLKGK